MLKTLRIDSVCVAIWSGDPTRDDVDVALRAVKAQSVAFQRPVPLLAVLQPGTSMPNDTVRKHMAGSWGELLECASTVQYVNLTQGFVSARLSMLLVPLFQLGTRGKVGVHQSLTPALRALIDGDPKLPAMSLVTLQKQIQAAIA